MRERSWKGTSKNRNNLEPDEAEVDYSTKHLDINECII